MHGHTGAEVDDVSIYIAGPMSGIEDFNYPAFRAAETQLRALGYDVLNPADIEAENTTGEPQPWEWYMRAAIHMVARADAMALLPGWENSTGATLEHKIGTALKHDIRLLERWLS
jgi:hypothetical protein